MNKRLSELDASFVSDGTGQRIGVQLDCPCGCDVKLFVPFKGAPGYPNGWDHSGETIETLTLSPSVFRNPQGGPCPSRWHGFIRDGQAIPC